MPLRTLLMRGTRVAALACAGLACLCQAAPGDSGREAAGKGGAAVWGPAVELPGTHTRELYSEIVGQAYELQVNLPSGCSDAEAACPVFFLLDAQWDYPLLYAIYGEQHYDGFIPDLVLVGITWGGEDPDPDVLRRRDFTPTDESGRGDGGGAANFLAFIERELVPFIEREYHTTADRYLAGSSLGGLFTLYALLQRPGLFNGYIATSPATPWDGGVIYRYADGFADRAGASRSRLYVAVGEVEELRGPVTGFVDWLRDQRFPGLSWTAETVAGAGHSGVKAQGNTRGLQYLFRDDPP